MFRLLLGLKIVIYGLVFYRVFEKTPASVPLVLLAVALVVSGFWRNVYEYRRPRVNTITLHLDLALALIFSLLSDKGSFDKLFIVYMLEGIAILPKPYFIVYLALSLVFNGVSTALYELRTEGVMLPPALPQALLYLFMIILVWGERRQREQRLAYEKLAEELRYVNLQLSESMAWSESLALEAERRRIAGEIHDSLGHDLTGLILTLEAGKRLAEREPDAGRDYWDKALLISRNAIESVRELVSTAREAAPGFELVPRLREMALGVEELTGLKVELDIDVEYTPLSRVEQLNLYRVFQEAVTNTLRHADAEHARITVSSGGEGLYFAYWDDGCGTDKIIEGNGLPGMIDRVSDIGGTISFQSRPGGGFKIEGRINGRGSRG